MLRKLEILLWLAAIVLLGAYAWVYLDREVYQAYTDWKFERALDHEPAPVLGFLWRMIRFGGGEQISEEDKSAALETFTPEPAKPAASPHVETPREGVVGRIEIPRIGVRAMILEGTSTRALRRAVGHIEGTALPGEPGNVGLAGHRDTFFAGLKNIRTDDVIRVKTLEGTFDYVVESIRIVGPQDVEVLSATTQAALTLVTCYPFNYVGSAPRRYVVRAVAVSPTLQSHPSS